MRELTNANNSIASITDSDYHNPIVYFSFGIAVLALITAMVLGTVSPSSAMYPIVFLFGWTQVSTPCGRAIVGAFGGMAQHNKRRWILAMAIFTVAGLVSSGSVGALLGVVGGAPFLRPMRIPLLAFLSVLSLLLALRELRVISFPLWQRCQPSIGKWRSFGQLESAAMWGCHIGLGFATFLNFGGPYVLAILALIRSDTISPVLASTLLFGSYWLGRAASAWIVPLLIGRRSTIDLLRAVGESRSLQEKIHAGGLLVAALVGGLQLFTVVH